MYTEESENKAMTARTLSTAQQLLLQRSELSRGDYCIKLVNQ